MELASMESADQIVEELSSELPIQSIYGAYTRTLNESRPETMKFHFTDFGINIIYIFIYYIIYVYILYIYVL